MKIRTDFVTNSSSSSFVAISIKSEKFAELVDKYFDILEEYDVYFDFENEDVVHIEIDEMFIDKPYWKAGILDAFLEGLQYARDIKNFGNELDDKKNEIVDDIEFFKFERSDSGWGEDEARFDKSNYNEEDLRVIYEKIAERKECKVEDITEKDFFEYVVDCSSIKEVTVTYTKETDKLENKYKFIVE